MPLALFHCIRSRAPSFTYLVFFCRRHRAWCGHRVAGGPATDLGALGHLVVGKHYGGLDVIVLVRRIGSTGRGLEGQPEVKTGRIVGCLNPTGKVMVFPGARAPFLLAKRFQVEGQRPSSWQPAQLSLLQAGGTRYGRLSWSSTLIGRDPGWNTSMVLVGTLPSRAGAQGLGTAPRRERHGQGNKILSSC